MNHTPSIAYIKSMNDLLKRMKKQSVCDTEILKNSRFFNESEFIDIGHPILNLALSGKVDGGFTNGLTIFAGPSKHFKSSYMCMLMAAFLKKNKDGVVIFYDSEFGSKQSYFTNFGVDTSRVLHVPIMNIEELKFDCIKKLEDIKLGEKVMFAIDSVGNLASKKEIEDALGENSAADMTRAKQLKSFGRMVTPYLSIKNIPMVAVNHTYSTMETYSQQVMGGGCLLPGTKIIMESGESKFIEDVIVGDKVLTKDGVGLVSKTWDEHTLIDPNPECYEIEFEDGYIVKCSENHKFLIDGKWVEAKYLVEGDYCQSNTSYHGK